MNTRVAAYRGRAAGPALVAAAMAGALGFGVLHGSVPQAGTAAILAAALVLCAGVAVVLLRRRPAGEDLVREMCDLLEDEVWLIERGTGIVAYLNAAAASRLDLSPSAAAGRLMRDIVPQQEGLKLLDLLAQGAAPAPLRLGARDYLPVVRPLAGGRHVMLVLRDVTDALAEERIKQDFVSTVSHELRSPLTSIKGAMGLLLSNAAGDLPKPARGLLEIAHRNSERLILIINDILDLQKIADGGTVAAQQDTDAAALVQEALAASGMFLQRFDLEIEVIGGGHPVPLRSDPNRIIQVLGNLLTNAAKFSKPQGRITVVLEQDPQAVTIRVRDEGEGIPQAEQSKIFDRFADMSNSDRSRKGGSGLGLSICKAIVDQLGGTISFESTQGIGTTFSFSLPREAGRSPLATTPQVLRQAG